MKKKEWKVIGLMSGTSLDGIDLVFVKFSKENSYSFEILASESVEYSELWKNKLKNAFSIFRRKNREIGFRLWFFFG